jgi:hypothetical protein
MKLFWKDQQFSAVLSIVCGLLFWIAHSFIVGVRFAIFLYLIQQLPILYDLCSWRRIKKKSGKHALADLNQYRRANNSGMVEVVVRLDVVNDDSVAVDEEFLWAENEEPAHYRVKSIPFYAPGISYNDLVAVIEKDGRLLVSEVVSTRWHSTIRVGVYGREFIGRIRTQLSSLGCNTEANFIKGFLAVDIPANVDYGKVLEMLSDLKKKNKILFEEPVINHNRHIPTS